MIAYGELILKVLMHAHSCKREHKDFLLSGSTKAVLHARRRKDTHSLVWKTLDSCCTAQYDFAPCWLGRCDGPVAYLQLRHLYQEPGKSHSIEIIFMNGPIPLVVI